MKKTGNTGEKVSFKGEPPMPKTILRALIEFFGEIVTAQRLKNELQGFWKINQALTNNLILAQHGRLARLIWMAFLVGRHLSEAKSPTEMYKSCEKDWVSLGLNQKDLMQIKNQLRKLGKNANKTTVAIYFMSLLAGKKPGGGYNSNPNVSGDISVTVLKSKKKK